MLFVLFKSSITSLNTSMYGDKTLVIIASDLVHAEENFGSYIFCINVDKQSFVRKLWPDKQQELHLLQFYRFHYHHKRADVFN
jgi:hypothetical protein